LLGPALEVKRRSGAPSSRALRAAYWRQDRSPCFWSVVRSRPRVCGKACPAHPGH
jgi:hypothetical protein